MGPETAPKRRTPRGARRRAELLDFAARRFAADGYHTTSVASIVEGLGVGKGVFYWYFDSKDELLRQILADAHHAMRLAQRDAIAGELDPLRRIELGIRSSLRWLSEHRHLFVVRELARTDERFAGLIREHEAQTIADALPHVQAGIAATMLRRDDPEVLTLAILGVTGHLARTLVLERGEDPERAADAVVAFCRFGLSAGGPAPAPRPSVG